jgi:hypothetical protein
MFRLSVSQGGEVVFSAIYGGRSQGKVRVERVARDVSRVILV